MCLFFSSVLRRNGDLVYLLPVHNHTTVMSAFGIPDQMDREELPFVKLEYTVKEGGRPWMIEDYALRVDEDYVPEWCTEDVQADAVRRLRAIVGRCLINDRSHPVLVGDVWVLGPEAHVEIAEHVRIESMQGQARIDYVGPCCEIRDMYDTSSIGEVGNNSHVARMGDSAGIESLVHYASITEMRDESWVRNVSGHASIEDMLGTSRVEVLDGRTRVDSLYEGASVWLAEGSAEIYTMGANAVLRAVNAAYSAGVRVHYAEARAAVPDGVPILQDVRPAKRRWNQHTQIVELCEAPSEA